MNDKQVRIEEFLKLFRDPVFVTLDEKKENPPRHMTSLKEAMVLNEDGRSGAYFSVNGFANFSQTPHRKREFVTSLNGHYIDIDNPTKSSQEIINEATLLAAEKDIPFTCTNITGRGVHGYWIFKEPILNPTEEQKVAYLSVQASLIEMFGGDEQAKDIPRILRIPLSKYWRDGSGKEIELGTITDNLYSEGDFTKLLPPAISVEKKKFTPTEDVLHAKHGERHGKSFILALKFCSRFSDSHDMAHAAYRGVIDQYYERVAGDPFHNPGGEADTQFEDAWEQVQSKPHIRQREAREADKPNRFKQALSFGALMSQEFPAPQWAVEKLFEAETINMIGARPNHFKSWVVLEIALAMAKGAKLFGTFQTSQQSVMIVNEEDSVRMLQQRIKMLDPKSETLPIYFHVQEGLTLTEHDVTLLIKEAQSKSVTTLVFDSLRSVHNEDENSSQGMQIVMNQLKRFTREGMTVLFTHHNRKKPIHGGGKEDGEESRGSSGINAAVHGYISLTALKENGQNYIVVRQQKLKGEEKIPPFELVITPIPWGFAYREHKESERPQNSVNDKVASILAFDGVWLSADELVESAAGGLSSVRSALKNLVALKQAEMKTRKEVMDLGLPVRSKNGALNQNLYHYLPEEDEEGDPAAD